MHLSEWVAELMNDIPERVHLLPEIKEYKALEQPFSYSVKKHMWKIAIGRTVGKLRSQGYSKRFKGMTDIIVGTEYKQKYTIKHLPVISENEYDMAISFMIPHYVVAEKVKAKIKLAWVHTDYTKMHLDVESEYDMWNQYDHIVAVSEGVADSFIRVFPGLKEKVIIIENILPEQMILEKANNEVHEFDPATTNLLSIGRFASAKNFKNIPDICKKMIDKGYKIKWYLIGYGPEEDMIKDRINELNMNDFVIVLGKKDNPYPYIKACDYYVQPSRYEGKAVTVREAQILGKPVIITAYETSGSQLINGYDGWIVPLENELCAKGIAELISDKKKTKEISENCLKQDYSNKKEIQKIYKMIT